MPLSGEPSRGQHPGDPRSAHRAASRTAYLCTAVLNGERAHLPRTGFSLIADRGAGTPSAVHAVWVPGTPAGEAKLRVTTQEAGVRGLWRGRRDTVGVLILHPGQVLDPAQASGRGRPGIVQWAELVRRPEPGMSVQGRPAAVQLVGTAAARNVRILSWHHVG